MEMGEGLQDFLAQACQHRSRHEAVQHLCMGKRPRHWLGAESPPNRRPDLQNIGVPAFTHQPGLLLQHAFVLRVIRGLVISGTVIIDGCAICVHVRRAKAQAQWARIRFEV